ncbi:hypothetical protein Vadar_021521 [Vaccinium darrowii]|uniref:Uncharacterized protein n=1 Tax=Vaccinium darrowii TaxID=229202 RepID=A0ACB7XSW6_9ERIC|nr:hypothetical protein Vadar_021521 [Vaccinium darrowii]
MFMLLTQLSGTCIIVVFPTKTAWEAIRTKGPIVPWHKAIWFPRSVPRWAIILWIALLGRLSTKDRLLAWGVTSDDVCTLCGADHESHDHLFFGCQYASRIWSHFFHLNGVNRHGLKLRDEEAWIVQHSGGSSMKNTIYKLSLAAVVYNIWRERNGRIFKG